MFWTGIGQDSVALYKNQLRLATGKYDYWRYTNGGKGGLKSSLWGTGGSEPPASRTLLSHFPYLYLPAPALFSPAPVPYKLGDSKHILVI